MKVFSIGRDLGCDIIIDDNSDVISRRHATLNVSSSGKMTIVDLSHNGTYVNGIRINQNVPVPVTRDDTISFAHIAQLDWNQIPNTRSMIIRYTLLGLLAVLLVTGGVWGLSGMFEGNKPAEIQPAPAPIAVDSTEIKKKEEKKKEVEKERMDSIKKHVQDSLDMLRQKSNVVKTKKSDSKKSDSKKADTKKNGSSKKDEPKQKRIRG